MLRGLVRNNSTTISPLGVAMTGLDQTGEAVIGGGSRASRGEAKHDCENGTLHNGVHQSTSGES